MKHLLCLPLPSTRFVELSLGGCFKFRCSSHTPSPLSRCSVGFFLFYARCPLARFLLSIAAHLSDAVFNVCHMSLSHTQALLSVQGRLLLWDTLPGIHALNECLLFPLLIEASLAVRPPSSVPKAESGEEGMEGAPSPTGSQGISSFLFWTSTKFHFQVSE